MLLIHRRRDFRAHTDLLLHVSYAYHENELYNGWTSRPFCSNVLSSPLIVVGTYVPAYTLLLYYVTCRVRPPCAHHIFLNNNIVDD
jgi:hypothetical protein